MSDYENAPGPDGKSWAQIRQEISARHAADLAAAVAEGERLAAEAAANPAKPGTGVGTFLFRLTIALLSGGTGGNPTIGIYHD